MTTGNRNRRIRTRKDLLFAAARLLKAGKTPSLEEVAKEALVSRATAYRYFTNIDELLLEVQVDAAVPDPEALFSDGAALSLAERIDRAEAQMHQMMYENEVPLRLLLAQSVRRSAQSGPHADKKRTPVRQNRRAGYIEQALAPYRRQLDAETYRTLSAALALVFGPEAMVIFRDVHPLPPERARHVKRWMIHALTNAALLESQAKRRKKARSSKR